MNGKEHRIGKLGDTSGGMRLPQVDPSWPLSLTCEIAQRLLIFLGRIHVTQAHQ